MNKSHLTALSRTKPSTPVKWLVDNGYAKNSVLDYGCGKGFDADFYGFDRFDPYYHNFLPQKTYDTIICCYVLNVIDSEAERAETIKKVLSYLNPQGEAFFVVRNDVPAPIYISLIRC